jgi:hypothetical protein
MPIRKHVIRITPVRFTTHASRLVATDVDAFLLVVILAPVLWWLTIHSS